MGEFYQDIVSKFACIERKGDGKELYKLQEYDYLLYKNQYKTVL
jgi:hypothetical protein